MFYGKNGPTATAQKNKINGKLAAQLPSQAEKMKGTTPARNHAAATKKRHAKIKMGLSKAFPASQPPINQPFAKKTDGGNY